MPLKPYKTDVAVLILFFNRPDHLQKVFDEVRKAQPSKLFLYQDGPRGERDMAGIEACRSIVSNIDWDCEVHRKFQERNYGCDPSEYISQKWAFSIVDKCIVLEDDDVPSQSFFTFCKEMLDRYEHDERIGMIAGFNPEEKLDGYPSDYLFTSVFSIWGWASWRRVIDKWDASYAFLDDPNAMRQVEGIMRQRQLCRDTLRACYDHRASGKEYYETIFWASMLLNSALAIMPTRNLINNLGATDGSTHYTGSLQTMPRRLRRLFTMKRFEFDAPLRHPRYIIEDVDFKEKVYRTYAYGHPWIKAGRSMEELWLNLKYGNFGHIARSVANRVAKILGTDKTLSILKKKL